MKNVQIPSSVGVGGKTWLVLSRKSPPGAYSNNTILGVSVRESWCVARRKELKIPA
jgi:hypothetical protein